MKSKKMIGRTAGAVAAAVALVLSLAACGSDSDDSGGGSKPKVIMGTKDFSEQFLLGELYAQALNNAGFNIELKKNIGSSEIIDKALTTKKIDMYPEYTGVIYSNKDLADLGDHPESKEVTYAGAKKWEASRGYTMLKPTPFQDADGFAVTKAYQKKYNLKTIDDMKSVKSFTYAGPPENGTRYQGVVGLKKAYGLNQIQFKPLGTGAQYAALDNGSVDTIAVFTTDGQLASGKYVVLPDTKGIFGFQQVAPVIRNSVIKQQGAEFSEVLNKVSALLTTKAIIAMNSAVQIDKKDPGAVAKSFLDANGLGKK
ncbi:MAG: hypothetical protein INR66_21805 [Gordonia polyisoprenivorans]|nr:hypothetical protein [Gordonia polyisoprenivorans]